MTSSQPREGKTSTALNLAVSLTQMGRKVLVLDADLRRPRLHAALGLENRAGLSNALSGAGDGLGSLIAATKVPNLSLLPSGPPPPNPAELLDSEEFGALMQRIDSFGFDHVIVDSPPCLAVADAAIISARMDAVIMVVQAGVTPRDLVARGAQKLRAVKARVLGGLLNMVDTTAMRRYDRAYYGAYEERSASARAITGRQ